MNYKEASTKIFDAYFRDEIQPYNANFCFCGTLNNNNSSWFNSLDKVNGVDYSHEELKRMEYQFLVTINRGTINTGRKLDDCENDYLNILNHPKYEDALFEGMYAALEVLKEIHRSRGENIDEESKFIKRDLKEKQAFADGFNAPEPCVYNSLNHLD